MHIVSLFLLGLGILIGALIINSIATALGLLSWYTFLEQPSRADVWSYIWLLFLYPLALGGVAYVCLRALNIV